MATYKVPQDVEAEDKLVAFLSLKQFIFVIIMLAALWMAYILARINILLGILPLPIAFVFGMLGLWQRSDQPVEVFFLSWIRFHTKPRKRIWDQEGFEQRVIITAPPKVQKNYTNNLTADQVSSRLSQLSSIMDSRGWASKYAVNNAPTTQIESTEDGRHFHESERLFTARELTQFAPPPALLDEATGVDAYENDPRNRTAQIVSFDMKEQEQAAKQHALAIVEQARSEKPVTPEPEGTSVSTQKHQPPKPPIPATLPKQPEDEVTIEISHH